MNIPVKEQEIELCKRSKMNREVQIEYIQEHNGFRCMGGECKRLLHFICVLEQFERNIIVNVQLMHNIPRGILQ